MQFVTLGAGAGTSRRFVDGYAGIRRLSRRNLSLSARLRPDFDKNVAERPLLDRKWGHFGDILAESRAICLESPGHLPRKPGHFGERGTFCRKSGHFGEGGAICGESRPLIAVGRRRPGPQTPAPTSTATSTPASCR